MDPRISGTTSGVRVFTILVLSGSLFFLIYQMGRKRMGNPKNPDAVNEAAASSSSSSRGLARNSKGYFSHHYERAYPNNASLSRALDSPNSLRTIGGVGGMKFASSSSKKSSDVGSRYGMEHNSSESHEGTSVSSDLSEDAMEMGSYMLPRRPSSANSGAGSLNSGQRASEAIHYNHEQSFLEHLRHNSSLNAQRRSRNNFLVPRNLGDMSLIEQRGGLQRQSNKEVSGVPRGKGVARVEIAECSADRDRSGENVIRPDEVSIPLANRAKSFLRPLSHIVIWCALSHSYALYTRTGMGAKMATFPAPFFRITVHFFVQSIIASCMLRWPTKRGFSLSWDTFLWRVIPVAAAAAWDHNPQSTSLTIICVTLKVPVCKAWLPLIVFFFATAFKLEDQSPSLLCNIVTISVGFILSVSREADVELWNMKGNMVGSIMSGFRWATTQSLLQNRKLGLVSPVVTMRALAPTMATVTAILSVVGDPWSSLDMSDFFDTPQQAVKSWAHILIGALLETSVALAELVVIYHTSANTLIIVAMLKEVLTSTIPNATEKSESSSSPACSVDREWKLRELSSSFRTTHWYLV